MLSAVGMWVALLWLAAIAEVDRRHGRIPHALVLPAVAVTGAAAGWHPGVGVAAAVATLPYLLAFLARACGGGDVKLAVPCGGLVGDPLAAAVLTVLAAAVCLIVCAFRRRRSAPHAPALVAATALLVLVR